MKKGFTLIELLGVLVLLSIIALIATPIVNNIVDSSRRELFRNSAYGLVSAGTVYYNEKLFDDYLLEDKLFLIVNGNFDGDKLSVIGQLPKDGRILVDTEGRVSIAIFNGRYCALKGLEDTEIKLIDDLNKDDCLSKVKIKTWYKEEILKGSDPVISTGMIPVIISDGNLLKDDGDVHPAGTVVVADLYEKWYEYNNKQWANMVLVDEVTRNNISDDKGVISSAVGTVIEEANILAYFVWIPRYEYTLWNITNNGTGYLYANSSEFNKMVDKIVINFQSVDESSNGDSVGSTLTHPAFSFGNEELSGFWVGKFESSKNTQNNSSETIGNGSTLNLRIKPNVISWRDTILSVMYYAARGMTIDGSVLFGLDKNDSDPHMMKNMEWGAVAYLSHSIYGASSSTNEIRINNSNTYITGCAATANSINKNGVGCANTAYNDKWNTDVGITASTTGNITGIYDMSGGAREYVMGYSKLGGNIGKLSGFIESDFDDVNGFVVHDTNVLGKYSRYVDLYDYTEERIGSSSRATNYSTGKLGDATRELGPMRSGPISQFHFDAARFVDSSAPWFARGGYYLDYSSAGIFNFYVESGYFWPRNSFRVVIASVAQLD